MTYNFVKFQGTNKRTEERITVTKSAGIGFPTKFFIDNDLALYRYVILYWDKNANTIGIQFTNNEEEKDKFKLIKSNRGYGGNIQARSFYKENGIDVIKYHGRYKWEKVDIDGIGLIYTITLVEKNKIVDQPQK